MDRPDRRMVTSASTRTSASVSMWPAWARRARLPDMKPATTSTIMYPPMSTRAATTPYLPAAEGSRGVGGPVAVAEGSDGGHRSF